MERATSLGMNALGLTEHGNINGWLDFYDAAKDAGIKPALGIEAYQARKTRYDVDEEERSGRAADEFSQRGPHHLTVLARNLTGYKNAIRLSSRAYLEGYFGKPRLDMELLHDHGDGLIILSGCLSGKIQQAILRGDHDYAYETACEYQDIVGKGNFGIEIMSHGIPEEEQVFNHLVELAKKVGAPLIPTCDCHYVHKEEADSHDLMLAVATSSTIHDPNRFKFSNDEFYLKSYDEMALLFPDEWLKNTMDLSDRIDIELNFGQLYFPEFDLPPGKGVDEYFEDLVWRGVEKRYPGWQARNDVRDRVEHELRVVRKMGFQHYYLVVGDIVNWAKAAGIRVGWGRGSAAGSILAYAMEITNLEPLRFGLLFERFLVEGRKSMPDIDLDFDDVRREEVIEYIRTKYGTDRVANIATYASVGAKSAIKDATRALGYSYADGDKLSKMVPKPILGVFPTLTQALESKELIEEYKSNKDSKIILDAAKGLEGLVRSSGMHPAGIVITPGPMIDYVPVMQKGIDKPIVAAWDMGRIEEIGLLKIDCLGLRNLRVIDQCVNLIKKSKNIDIDIDDIPLDHLLSYKRIEQGKTMGMFQLESPGMSDMAMSMKPTSLDDIMALISLFRPGPMGSGMDKHYIARKNGRQRVSYPDERLRKTLGSTYGVMLYQENVLNVAKDLAGFSAGEADDLRKVIGKKLMDKIPLYRKKFVEGCIKNGVAKDIADKVYSDIEYFGGYGFNLAHAASYAMLSYVTAYLKTCYPAEYMAALISSVTKNVDKASLYLNECRRLDIVVRSPSINKSEEQFIVLNDEEILFGFSSIGGIGGAIFEALVERNDYKSIWDFMRRSDPMLMNKRVIENLLEAGTFDELVDDLPERPIRRSERIEILGMERERLGLYVSDHPLQGIWHVLENDVTHEIANLITGYDHQQVTVSGILSRTERKNTKRGDPMWRFILEDLSASIEGVMFHKETAIYNDLMIDGNIVCIEGSLRLEGDEENPIVRLIASKITEPEIPDIAAGDPIILRLDDPDSKLIDSISQLIEESPGDSPVYLHLPVDKHIIVMKFQKPTSISIKNKLMQLVQLENSIKESYAS